MESFNLKTASGYINNLLLARGLLRNGTAIEFAHPSKGEGGKEATMAQIINLVHDMVLRRDREQDQRESLAQTLRTLRAESAETSTSLSRLHSRNEDLSRQLALSQSAERAAKSALKAAEHQTRLLREDGARLKASVAQIRAACANDVRKRDVQIQRLKGHLTEGQRGSRAGGMGATITITPGMSSGDGRGKGIGGMAGGNSRGAAAAGVEVNDPAYSLRQETTEFLTQLSQSLSDENDGLIGIVRHALATLRELQGTPENAQRGAHPGQMLQGGADEQQQMGSASCEALAAEMDGVLDSLRSILTNPNFVPIEEVVTREEEILKLREGWDKMEVRWREAVNLMDGWRQRMLEGDTVNLEDLRQGMGLAGGLDAVPEMEEDDVASDIQDDEARSEELDEMLADIAEHEPLAQEPSVIAPHSGLRTDTKAHDGGSALKPLGGSRSNIQTLSPRKSAFSSIKRNGYKKDYTASPADENSEVDLLPEPTSKLLDSSASHRRSTPRNTTTLADIDPKETQESSREATSSRPRKVRFTSSTIDPTSVQEVSFSSPSPHFDASYHQDGARSFHSEGRRRSRSHPPRDENETPKHASTPYNIPPTMPTRLYPVPPLPHSPITYLYIDPLQNLKRHSSPTRHSDEPSPKMTVQEKLNVARAEAEAAAVAAGLVLDELDVKVDEASFQQHEEGEREDHERGLATTTKVPLKGSSPRKPSGTGMKGRARRRKSTLTPEELERLMGV